MKSLFVPLKTEYFNAFKEGRKTVEYRLYGPRWNEKQCAVGRGVRLRLGYSGEDLHGEIVGFEIKNIVDLPEEVVHAVMDCYQKDIGRIACIEIKLGPTEAVPLKKKLDDNPEDPTFFCFLDLIKSHKTRGLTALEVKILAEESLQHVIFRDLFYGLLGEAVERGLVKVEEEGRGYRMNYLYKITKKGMDFVLNY